MDHISTAKNSPTRALRSSAMIHPSGLETSDFEIYEPSRQQIESAARRGMHELSPHPRPRPISPLRWILAAIALLCLAYAGTYFVLSKVLG